MSHRHLTSALAALTLTVFCTPQAAYSQLKGEYLEINVTKENEAIAALMKGTDRVKQKVASQIQSHSDEYAPVVFYHLASYLHRQGEAEAALSWLYRGRIRTYFDIQRCTDPSVRDAGDVLNQQLPQRLVLEQFRNIENSKRLMQAAVKWDRDTPHNYDGRWIALHGIRASLPQPAPGYAQALLISHDQWVDLAENHRSQYLTQWMQDVSQLSEEQLVQLQAKYDELSVTESSEAVAEETADDTEAADDESEEEMAEESDDEDAGDEEAADDEEMDEDESDDAEDEDDSDDDSDDSDEDESDDDDSDDE